ncbi:MAG: hypothetical protein K2H09_03750 [Treponemataceae bacterium]|nr:hypothetical protein [Treponemataceae bacterium]
MDWSTEEDKACCKACVDKYVISDAVMDCEDFVDSVSSLPEFQRTGRDKGSIRMKIQNIKSLLDKLHIKNSVPISPLGNASKQSRMVLKEILKEHGLIS